MNICHGGKGNLISGHPLKIRFRAPSLSFKIPAVALRVGFTTQFGGATGSFALNGGILKCGNFLPYLLVLETKISNKPKKVIKIVCKTPTNGWN